MCDNSSISCRGCLSKVTDGEVYSFVWPEIKELFVDCTAIEIPPDEDRILPQQICSECLSKCEQWYTFKKMCHEINQHLREKLPCPKEEPEVIELDDSTDKEDCVDMDDEDLNAFTFGELISDPEEAEQEPLSLIERLEKRLRSDRMPSIEEDSLDTGNTSDTAEPETAVPPETNPQSTLNNSTPDLLECPLCRQGMRSLADLHIHFVEHTQERPYVCSYCSADYTTRAGAECHVRVRHPGKPADECAVVVKKGSMFEKKRPWEAMGHFLYSRPTVRPVVIVPRQKDVQESSDSEDKETHSTKHSYSVECPVCQKAILLKSLAAHCVLHTEERPFACTSCDADFTSRPTAIMHVRDNHPGQKDTGYTVKKGSIFNMTRPWEAMGFTTLQRTSKPPKKKKRREVPDDKKIAEDVAKIKKYLLLADNCH